MKRQLHLGTASGALVSLGFVQANITGVALAGCCCTGLAIHVLRAPTIVFNALIMGFLPSGVDISVGVGLARVPKLSSSSHGSTTSVPRVGVIVTDGAMRYLS